jgi:ligand-binding sensor domain-containing protein
MMEFKGNGNWLCVAVMLFAFFCAAVPGIAATDAREFRFYQPTREEGLPDHNVKAIFKDSDGFMWFGTRNGLCRYDGMDFVLYRAASGSQSPAGNRILSIAEDKRGFLWIGTHANGLSKMDRSTGAFVHYNLNDGIGNRVNRIVSLDDGSLWICSNNGLARYLPENDGFELFQHDSSDPHSLNSHSVFDLLQTRTGEIYVATESTFLQKFDQEARTFQELPYKRHPDLVVNYEKRMAEGPDGSIYVVANLHGLARLKSALQNLQ